MVAEVGGMTLLTKKKRASSGLRLILFLNIITIKVLHVCVYVMSRMKSYHQYNDSVQKRCVEPYEEVELSNCEI